MCANSKDHEAWIQASKAGDQDSADAIASGKMTAADYERKVTEQKAASKKAAEEAPVGELATA